MKNSSLKIATQIIIEALDKSNKLDNIDKAELMLNITQFLKENEYRDNIRILAKRRNNTRKIDRRIDRINEEVNNNEQ